MTIELGRFRFRKIQKNWDEGVVLVCLTCNEQVYGQPMDGLGIGDAHGGAEFDDDLDVVMFQAEEHQSLYCKGASS